MKFKKNKIQISGYITLISVLIVGAVGIAIATSLLLLGLSSSRTSFTIEQSSQARALADACAEKAITSLIQDENYQGNETINLGQGSCDILQITSGGGGSNLYLEAGTVNTDENWATVNLQNTYTSPVVITSYYEANNFLPVSTRVRNVTTTSFEVRLQNHNESDLSSDEISYFVVDEGTWEINGVKLEAHKYDTSTVGYSGNWQYDTQTFSHTFAVDPVVYHQAMTYNDANWITTYVSDINSQNSPPTVSGIRIALNGAEAMTSHSTETIGWIGVDRNITGLLDGVNYETLITPSKAKGHDNGCFTSNYQNTYSSSPVVLGYQEAMSNNDGSWAVKCSNSSTQVGMHEEEDQAQDSERREKKGDFFAFIAFANAFNASVPIGSGDGSFTIKTTGTVDSVIRKVQVQISQITPQIEVSAWQEVADL